MSACAYNDFQTDWAPPQIPITALPFWGPLPRRDRALREAGPQGHPDERRPREGRPGPARPLRLGPSLPRRRGPRHGNQLPRRLGRPRRVGWLRRQRPPGQHRPGFGEDVHGQRPPGLRSDRLRHLPSAPQPQDRLGRGRDWLAPLRLEARLAVVQQRRKHRAPRVRPQAPSKRQSYAPFWFEKGSALDAIRRVGADNFLYETDFPHPTSMSPGPASVAQVPKDFVEDVFTQLSEEDARFSTTTRSNLDA